MATLPTNVFLAFKTTYAMYTFIPETEYKKRSFRIYASLHCIKVSAEHMLAYNSPGV